MRCPPWSRLPAAGHNRPPPAVALPACCPRTCRARSQPIATPRDPSRGSEAPLRPRGFHQVPRRDDAMSQRQQLRRFYACRGRLADGGGRVGPGFWRRERPLGPAAARRPAVPVFRSVALAERMQASSVSLPRLPARAAATQRASAAAVCRAPAGVRRGEARDAVLRRQDTSSPISRRQGPPRSFPDPSLGSLPHGPHPRLIPGTTHRYCA